jgi:hypothetical protein
MSMTSMAVSLHLPATAAMCRGCDLKLLKGLVAVGNLGIMLPPECQRLLR